MTFCKFCGKPLQFEDAEICPSCGMRLKNPVTEETEKESKPFVEHKSPILAAILSWLFIGMGQIYVGRVGRGLVIMLMALFCVLLIFAGGIGLVFLIILDIASIYDAYTLAKEYNEEMNA